MLSNCVWTSGSRITIISVPTTPIAVSMVTTAVWPAPTKRAVRIRTQLVTLTSRKPHLRRPAGQITDAFRPTGNARLLFAQTPEGEPLATLFLVRCGPRVVEPYGGMTPAGGESRANYLLKWEAIRSSREAGATSYDLWGLATGGIAHFKAGFGGREVSYIGAWDLVLDRVGRMAYDSGQRGRVWVARRRRGLDTTGSAAAFGASE